MPACLYNQTLREETVNQPNHSLLVVITITDMGIYSMYIYDYNGYYLVKENRKEKKKIVWDNVRI